MDPKHIPLLRSVLTVGSAVALAYCAWHAVQLFSPPAPFAQLYTNASVAQNDEVTRQLIGTVIVGPVALAVLLLASWPALTATRTRTCFALGTIMTCLGFFGAALGMSLPYGFGSSYEHASDAQRLHMALSIRSGGAFFAAGVLLIAVGILFKLLSRAPNRGTHHHDDATA